MILIADSGGTKTEWRLIGADGKVKNYRCIGLNPYLSDHSVFDRAIQSGFTNEERRKVNKLFFYTAGCNSIYIKNATASYLKVHFPNATVTVQSDVEGAAKALFGTESGYVGLLGTGSGWAWFDGRDIRVRISGMGYILGDEGSGSDLGKRLLVDAFRGNMPAHLINKLSISHDCPEMLMRNLYDAPNQAQYLAQFANFIHEHLDDRYMYEMVFARFQQFVSLVIDNHSDVRNSNVGFVGSIAHNFRRVLIPVLSANGISAPHIINSPIEELIKFHSTHERIYQ